MKNIHQQIEKAQDALSRLCRDPKCFSMSVPANEESDIDLIIAKALRYANEMRIALEKIVNCSDNKICKDIAKKVLGI